jgi:hypothetical protein
MVNAERDQLATEHARSDLQLVFVVPARIDEDQSHLAQGVGAGRIIQLADRIVRQPARPDSSIKQRGS